MLFGNNCSIVEDMWRRTANSISMLPRMRGDLIEFLPRSEDIRAVVIDSIHTREVLQDE